MAVFEVYIIIFYIKDINLRQQEIKVCLF